MQCVAFFAAQSMRASSQNRYRLLVLSSPKFCLSMITEDMMTEPTSYAERLAERKESARRTLRDASSEELQALVAQLFPDGTHPFAEPFSKFIQEHDHEKAVRGETSDGISFVYYPRANQG